MQISGRNSFPNFVEGSSPTPIRALCPSLYRTECFSRGKRGREGAEKKGRGVASKGLGVVFAHLAGKIFRAIFESILVKFRRYSLILLEALASFN